MTITSEDRQTQSDAGSSAQEPSQEESPQEEHPPAPTMNPFQLVGKAIMEHASRQVANRMEAIQAVVIAFLTGQKMYIIGRPGMDTARIAGVASDFLQLPTALCHLHSQTTPAQLQGKVVRDSSRERRFAPGPLLETGERETQVAILSKLNRAPPQTLLSLSEFLSDDRRISVQGKSYPCSDIMTVIATGDLEEADSTIGELWSRFDCVLLTNSMGLEANRRTIDQRCDRSRYKDAETLIDYLRLTHNPKLTPPDGPDGECSSEQLVFLGDVIRQCRDIFETALVWVEGEPRHAAASIVDRFDDHKRWAVGVTDQTNKALIETATAISLLERGKRPMPITSGEQPDGAWAAWFRGFSAPTWSVRRTSTRRWLSSIGRSTGCRTANIRTPVRRGRRKSRNPSSIAKSGDSYVDWGRGSQSALPSPSPAICQPQTLQRAGGRTRDSPTGQRGRRPLGRSSYEEIPD